MSAVKGVCMELCGAEERSDVTPLLAALRWLPVPQALLVSDGSLSHNKLNEYKTMWPPCGLDEPVHSYMLSSKRMKNRDLGCISFIKRCRAQVNGPKCCSIHSVVGQLSLV